MTERQSPVRPAQVDVGRSMAGVFSCFDEKGAIVGEGVGGFFGSREFKRPYPGQMIELAYVTPRILGFKEPVTLDKIQARIKKKKRELKECPMETAMNLASLIADEGLIGTYYVVSDKQLDKSVRRDTPDFLKIERKDNGELGVLGWGEDDLLPLDDFLVFRVDRSGTNN